MAIPKRHLPRKDHGFYGPGSMAWEVRMHPMSELVAILRGAALVPLLIPSAAKALEDHSYLKTDVVGRYQESVYWEFASVFADRADATRAGKFVQGKHAKVKGYDPVGRTDYSVSRPDLAIGGHGLTWGSPMVGYDLFVRRLSPAEKDQYWREGFASADALGIDVDALPPTWAEWEAYYDETVLPTLAYTATAADYIQFGKALSGVPLLARPLARLGVQAALEIGLVTIGPVERSLLNERRSPAQLALARRFGTAVARSMTVPPVRYAIERSYGGHAHELLKEARAISAEHRGSGAGAPLVPQEPLTTEDAL